jgi:diguanylate cyclase (GGDEF)-like protein/PAS domain S-box-containing protein
MNLDIPTLAIVTCLTFLTQVVALFIQYRINRARNGIIWWLIGSIIWAIGVIFMPLVKIDSLIILAMVANPLVILGLIFLYVGIVRFLNKRENRWVLAAIFSICLILYYFFMFGRNEISARTVICAAITSILSFMCAWQLLKNKDRLILVSARYTGIVFFIFGFFAMLRFFIALFSPSIHEYSEMGEILALSFVVPIVVNLLWTFGFIIMVNQRLNAEIQEEKEKLQLIFNTSPDAALISRLSDGMIVDVNSGYLTMSGYSRQEIINQTTIGINIWHDLGDRDSFIKELKEKGFCENLEFVFQRKDRSLLTGRISARIISIKTVPHIVSIVHDITKSNQAAEALRESEELYRSILDASPDDITITDMNGSILVVSPAAKRIFGYESDYVDFTGKYLIDYLIPEDRERAKSNIIRMVKGELTGPNEYHGVRKDQSVFDIEVNSGLIHNAKGEPSKMVFVVRDITERKQTEQRIQQLVQQLEIEKKAALFNANTDSLTGLANRRYFDEVLKNEFVRLKRSGAPLSLLMLDVDYFKMFNDAYGHLAGDDCLKQVGTILKKNVGRVTDLVARFGGEEFAAVLTETDAKGAFSLAERIREDIEALAIPHADSLISRYLTVSLGVVTVNTNDLASPAQIIALADDALYCAKKDGRNRTAVAANKIMLV